jgi:uncharacterized membrane protein YdjX (TVP38/TMEM64 family)
LTATGPTAGASHWRKLLPSLGLGLWALALFVAGLLLAREFAAPIRQVLDANAALGIVVFVASSALAVLLPVLSNLPLVPLAVLAWGPAWTACLLLLGWVMGASLSFALARRARGAILRHFPGVSRHADIERLIQPSHRMRSLVLLRMTFPVDVLSYALGLFSRQTTAAEVALSTCIGAAPFALLFAWVPVLPAAAQWAVFGGSTLVFVGYAWWVLRAPRKDEDGRG